MAPCRQRLNLRLGFPHAHQELFGAATRSELVGALNGALLAYRAWHLGRGIACPHPPLYLRTPDGSWVDPWLADGGIPFLRTAILADQGDALWQTLVKADAALRSTRRSDYELAQLAEGSDRQRCATSEPDQRRTRRS